MFAIPLAIFVLPALLKNARYCPDPIEVGDSGSSYTLDPTVFESEATSSTSDEDPGHPPHRGPPSCEREILQRVDTPMEEVRDADMVDSHSLSESDKLEELGVDQNEAERIERLGATESTRKSELPGTWSPASKSESCFAKDAEIGSNGATGLLKIRSSESPSPPDALARRASSRVATLRAAFEQVDRVEEDSKRRFASGESVNGKIGDVRRELEAENSRLRIEVERERDLRLAYEERVTNLEDDLEDLNLQMVEQNEAWREECRQKCAEMAAQAEERLKAKHVEASTLERRVSELKRDISIATRTSLAVSDAYFQEQFGLLYHEIQNWIVNGFRRIKVEATPDEMCSRIRRVADPNQSEGLQHLYQEFDPTVRLPLYQSTVVNVSKEIFDFPYAFGLGMEESWYYHTRQAADALPKVLPPALYSRWRALTCNSIRQTEAAKNFVESSAHAISRKIISILSAITEDDAEGAKLASLTNIIKRVIELSDLMRVQQASYVFSIPSPGDPFDLETMEDTTIEHCTENGDAGSKHTVKFATSPSIIKISNENGERLDLRKVIMKATVFCKPDP